MPHDVELAKQAAEVEVVTDSSCKLQLLGL